MGKAHKTMVPSTHFYDIHLIQNGTLNRPGPEGCQAALDFNEQAKLWKAMEMQGPHTAHGPQNSGLSQCGTTRSLLWACLFNLG